MKMWMLSAVLLLATSGLRADQPPAHLDTQGVTTTQTGPYTPAPKRNSSQDRGLKLIQYVNKCLADRPGAAGDLTSGLAADSLLRAMEQR
jgi:hypothetical protein